MNPAIEAAFDDADAAIFAAFGDDATYTPPGEDAVPVSVRVAIQRRTQATPGGTSQSLHSFAARAPVGAYDAVVRAAELADPQTGGTLTIVSTGTVWRIESVLVENAEASLRRLQLIEA